MLESPTGGSQSVGGGFGSDKVKDIIFGADSRAVAYYEVILCWIMGRFSDIRVRSSKSQPTKWRIDECGWQDLYSVNEDGV